MAFVEADDCNELLGHLATAERTIVVSVRGHYTYSFLAGVRGSIYLGLAKMG